jgi:hypothetical protein
MTLFYIKIFACVTRTKIIFKCYLKYVVILSLGCIPFLQCMCMRHMLLKFSLNIVLRTKSAGYKSED